MDVSAFEAGVGEESPSLSEVVAFFDEDLRLPIAGAVAIVRHLLRLALLVGTLATCVLLYFFALAWLCLFWTQTRLFKYTSTFLNLCMSTTPSVTTDTKSKSRRNAEVVGTSQASRSSLAAEARDFAHLQQGPVPARVTTFANKTYGIIAVDKDAISREILQREEELEAEILKLVSAHEGSSTGDGLNFGYGGQTISVDDTTREKATFASESNEAPLAVETPVVGFVQQDNHLDASSSGRGVEHEPPKAAVFKLSKPKTTPKPRVDYAQQVKERKAREQKSFVEALTAKSIISTKTNNTNGGTTDAEHLKSVWNLENVAPPARSRPLTAITKATLSSGSPILPAGPKHQPKGKVAKHDHALQQPSALPPHVRSALDAKTRRAAADQHAYEATVKAKAAVPTGNTFAALSDDTASIDLSRSTHVTQEEADEVHLEKLGTDVIASQKSPSTPELVEQPLTLEPIGQKSPQEGTGFYEASIMPQPDHRDEQVAVVADKRVVYTLEALKATKNVPVDIQKEAVAGRIEAAAELVASLTRSVQSSRSPKKKPTRGRWDTFDDTKEKPPASGKSSMPLPAAEVSTSIKNAKRMPTTGTSEIKSQICDLSAVLDDCHDSTVSATAKADSVKEAVEISTEPVLDTTVIDQTTTPTSANLDLLSLEFDVPASCHQPAAKRIPSDGSQSLPITPGPLSFFAPKAEAPQAPAEHHTVSSAWRPEPEPIAFNPFVPGPFQSNAFHSAQVLQHFPPQQSHWIEPLGNECQDSFHMPQQYAPQTTPYSPMAPTYAYNETRALDNRRPSLAVPIRVPSIDISSEEAFPALGTTKSARTSVSPVSPPGLGSARSGTQATFDALLPTVVETPSVRALDLGKFISTATTSSASLDRTHGNAVSEVGSAVTAIWVGVNSPLASLKELSVNSTPHTAYDATFPELPKVIVSDMQVGDRPDDKSTKREKRKTARDALKDAFFEREEARKKLNGTFSFDGANELRQKTLSYLEKRSALRALMNSGTLNQQDADMFPELGLMDLSAPKTKAKVPGVEEWRSRKRESKVAVAEAAETACVRPSQQTDDIDPIIKDLIIAVRHRQESRDKMTMTRPQSNMAYGTWIATCRQTCARANKLYIRKRKILADAYPQGLPEELEMRFPDISARG